ncbi:MAG: YebC/PmpR family DNA-binding transcriptional regulator, partial [Dehalococcoidia bacterium]
DMTTEDDVYEIVSLPESFASIKEALDDSQIPVVSAEIAMIPKTTVKVEGTHSEQILKLMEALEESDDVQQVFSNFDIDDTERKA